MMVTTDTTAGRPASARPRRHRLVRAAAMLLGFCLVVALTASWLVYDVYRQLDRVAVDLSALPDRPPESSSGVNTLDIGLLGTVEGRLTSLMMLRIDADRRGARVLSLVQPGSDGPAGSARGNPETPSGAQVARAIGILETGTGVRLDHVAVFDWDLVARLVDRLGGVDVYLDPEAVDDRWTEHVLVTGDLVPSFVTQRSLVEHGTVMDAETRRARRQQRLLDTVVEQTLHQELSYNPIGLYQVLRTTASGLLVEQGWSAGSMAGLVAGLRHLRSGDIVYQTTPAGRSGLL